MSNPEIHAIRRELEDRGYSLAEIGRELGVARQVVSRTLRYPGESTRVRERIIAILGRDPWPVKNKAAGSAA